LGRTPASADCTEIRGRAWINLGQSTAGQLEKPWREFAA
jgi:hypothetical protein